MTKNLRKRKIADGWEIHELLDPDSFTRTTKYFHKRRLAPRVELTDQVSQQFAAYALIEKDLRSVKVWLQEVENLAPGAVSKGTHLGLDRDVYNKIKGFYVAALTFYGKCFTRCDGRRVKLDRNFVKQEFREAHDDVMHMRHNFAAHSGADNFEEVKIALVLPPKITSDDQPTIYRELTQIDRKDDADSRFIDLVESVQEGVLAKMGQIYERIMTKEVLPQGKSYWYGLAKKQNRKKY